MPLMNGQPMQPMTPVQPVSPVQPAQPIQPAQTMVQPGMPMVQQVQVAPEERKDMTGLIKTIAIIVVSLIAVTFIGLFIWMTIQFNEAQSDVDEKISVAVADAKDEQASKMEAEFLEREKYPFKVFAGPVDYGELSFQYPKTWSVYVADSAVEGGDYNAYFNPIQVDTVSEDTINALRVSIRNMSIDKVTEEYQREMESSNSNLTMEVITIGRDSNITANSYTGTIPDTELSGRFVTFKIRDKTVILQTDSTIFNEDFIKLLGTVTFVQ